MSSQPSQPRPPRAGRRRGTAVCAAIALLALPSAAALANGFGKTAYELYQQCDSVTSRFLQGVCLGYLGATVMTSQTLAEEQALFCLPDDLTPELLRRQFLSDVESNLVDRNAPADRALVAGLAARYPCGEDVAPERPIDPPAPEDMGLSVE